MGKMTIQQMLSATVRATTRMPMLMKMGMDRRCPVRVIAGLAASAVALARSA